MYLTKLDYGPVALMMILKVTALFFALRAVSTGSPRYLWGMSAACALGLFDKLNFIWFLLALVGRWRHAVPDRAARDVAP